MSASELIRDREKRRALGVMHVGVQAAKAKVRTKACEHGGCMCVLWDS